MAGGCWGRPERGRAGRRPTMQGDAESDTDGSAAGVAGDKNPLEGDALELYESVRAWRAGVAREARRRPFMVVTEAVMREVATARPTSEAALLAVKGIGPKKLERYGQALLDVVRNHVAERDSSRERTDM